MYQYPTLHPVSAFAQKDIWNTWINPAKNGEILVRSNYEKPYFTLLNSLGQKISISVSEMSDNQHKIKIKTSKAGIYFLIVESEGKVINRKVFIE